MGTGQGDLLLLQTEEALVRWRGAQLPLRPANGWIRNIRSALRMSAAALARRLAIGERAIYKLESSEADETITLGTLRRVAQAMDCELQYALVPKKPLDEMLMDQARAAAARQLGPIAHTMALEGQAVGDAQRKHLDLLARRLLARGKIKDLW
jgi:predicted DNA-binding mobile mystery protein A